MAGDSLNAPFDGRALHFIGVGGAGMSGLALVAQQLGATVTGSDQAESSYCERLRAAGIQPVIGHDASNVPDGAEVVVSTAIPDDNPELARARESGAPVLHRGDLLGELSRMKRTIAVSGTHGKTTTASMAALGLIETGREPAFVIGGELRAAGTNAAWGAGEWAVIEADESDRSFLKLGRDVAVVTNIELDHHSTYSRMSELEDAFAELTHPAAVRVLGPGVDLSGEGEPVPFGTEEGALRAQGVTLGAGSSRCRAVAAGGASAGVGGRRVEGGGGGEAEGGGRGGGRGGGGGGGAETGSEAARGPVSKSSSRCPASTTSSTPSPPSRRCGRPGSRWRRRRPRSRTSAVPAAA